MFLPNWSRNDTKYLSLALCKNIKAVAMRVKNMKYIQLTVAVSLTVSILIHFPELVSLFGDKEQGTLFPGISLSDVLVETGYAFVSLQILFGVSTSLFGFNRPSARMTWWKVLLSFVLAWLLSKLLGEAFVCMHHYLSVPAIDATVHHYLHPVRDFIMSAIVTGTGYIHFLIMQRQAVLVQNGELQAENVRNQYQVLKNQLNPHMLFNSLNTLQSLVRENPARAQNYIRELSRVLRYTLKEDDTHLVSLREEMDFAEAYIYLMKMRYEDNLHFDVSIDPCRMDFMLPPLSVQILIENAVKHNEISHRKPLTIQIRTEEEALDGALFLCVGNNLQPRRTTPSGTGIGLVNLAKRYGLLLNMEIRITETDGMFRVYVPLVQSHPKL